MLTQAWRIEMLGGLRARRGTQQVTRFRSGATSALLAHLAYYPDTLHRRVTLAGLLWPDAEPADALTSLRTALGSLRHQLEPPGFVPGSVLAADRDHIQLLPESFTTDAAEFESLRLAAQQVREGHQGIALLTQAHTLYRGDLLPGIDRNLEEDWVNFERERLRQAFYDLLLSLADLFHAQGDVSAALALAQRALKVDMQQETAHEHLMCLYAAQGKSGAAARQYRKLETILRDTLQIAPSDSVQAVYQDIKRHPQKYIHSAATPAAPPIDEKGTQNASAPLPVAAASVAALPSNLALPFLPEPLMPSFSDMLSPLPTCRTQFFGRQTELQQVTHWLRLSDAGEETGEQTGEDADLQSRSARLVTLTGHGGAGKTRLALEAVYRLRDAYKGRVLFLPLTDLPDAEGIADLILGAFCAPRAVHRDPLEQVLAVLSGPPFLLALDNFEHLLPPEDGTPESGTPETLSANAAAFVDALLERAPELRCLVTSRRRLELPGEREIIVRSLPTPTAPDAPERLLTYPGIKLFVDRAHLANPDFRFRAGNSAAIQTLCRHLEGIPLALELAAAWARTLSPAQMLAKLDKRLDFLRRDKGSWPARHLSLRAAIDGSYRMLPPNVKRFFVRLSAFRGGWTLDAAQAVAADLAAIDLPGDLPEEDSIKNRAKAEAMEETLFCLETLGHHSLIQAEEEGGEMRFFLLETLRAFCEEQMSPSERTDLSRRHAGWFMRMAEQADENLDGAEQQTWLDRLAREQENLRTALAWCLCDPASHLSGLRLAAALPWFWDIRCHLSEGRRWLTQFLAVTTEEEGAAGDSEDAVETEKKTAKEAEKGLAWTRARALSGAGWLALRQDDNEQGRLLYEECLHIRQRLQDQRGIGYALNGIGLAARQQGDFNAAYDSFKQALVLRQELGHAHGIASSLNNLALAAGGLGRYDESRNLYTQSLALAREQGNDWGIANALSNLGEVLTHFGEYREASELFAQSLPIKQRLHDGDGIANTLEAIAYMKAEQGQAADATHLLAASEALRVEIASPLPTAFRNRHDRVLAQLRAALNEAAFMSAWDEGRTLNREQAIAFALQTLRF